MLDALYGDEADDSESDLDHLVCNPRIDPRRSRSFPPSSSEVGPAGLRRERQQSHRAGFLAPSTFFGADAAVLMVLRVVVAFLCGSPAGVDTRLENDPRLVRHELRLSAENAACRQANVAAVQTERDAPQQGLDIRLAEVRVGARRAGLGTDEAFVDARGQDASFQRKRPLVRLQHLLRTGHDHSSRKCAYVQGTTLA